MRKKIIFSLVLFSLIFFVPILYYFNYYGHKRLNYIIDIPISAFDNSGRFVDLDWKKFLKMKKPIGVILFADHLENKEKSKKIIQEICNIVDEKNFFVSADEEGGRVNRMGWIDVLSASEIAEKYVYLKKAKGKAIAIAYVEKEYSKMFQEMRDVGINLTFAPNLDINLYADLDKNSDEYKYYKIAVKYVKMSRKNRAKLSNNEQQEYQKTLRFYAYLDEIGAKSLDIFTIDGKIGENKDAIETIRKDWKDLPHKYKQTLIEEFRPIVKYLNYASVVGDRSFGKSPKLIAEIAKIFVHTASRYGIKCVLKHALGHGRALGDTHNGSIYVDTPINVILEDLYPYKQLIKDVKFVMPSYIVYTKIDDKNTAISSEKVLNFFRKNVGEAVFIGDDMSMLGNNGDAQKCDIHIKSHNRKVEDILQIINKEDYVGRGVWGKWFE